MSDQMFGAWQYGAYRFILGAAMGKLSDPPTKDELRQHYAVMAIQRRLNTIGYACPKTGWFGWRTRRAVKRWQNTEKIATGPTGEIGRPRPWVKDPGGFGPLFHDRLVRAATEQGVPAEYLAGIIIHETEWDPAATHLNTDGSIDRGWVQINDTAHPEIEDEKAFDPVFSMSWELERLSAYHKKYASKPDIAWECAIAANLSPAGADQWFRTGTAPTDKMAKYVEDVITFGTNYMNGNIQ